jgi:hypothetical protein
MQRPFLFYMALKLVRFGKEASVGLVGEKLYDY